MAEYIDIVVTVPPQIVDITAVIGGSGGGGGGAVDSVNGQTGVVVLDAGDVGADPAGAAAQALSDANDYTDSGITTLSNATTLALNNKQDRLSQILTGGTITIVPTNTARVSSTTYYIKNYGNFSSIQTDFPLTLSGAGNQRYVGFYGNNSGVVVKVEGAEAPLASFPTQPADTTLFGYVLVGDASIGTTPDLSGYLLKADKATQADVLASTNDTKYVTALALQPTLDLKEDLVNKKSSLVTPNATDYLNTQGLSNYVQSQLATVIRDRGMWDASGNLFPTTGGSGSGGAVEKGNQWTISVSGTLGGIAVTAPYSVIRALVDVPGQTAANWFVENRSIPVAQPGSRTPIFFLNTTLSLTGTTAETILTPSAFFIPANTLKANTKFSFEAFCGKTGVAGIFEYNVYCNTSMSLVGAKNWFTTGSFLNNSIRTLKLRGYISNRNNVALQNKPLISSNDDATPSTNAIAAINIDFGVNQYVFVTGKLANSADTLFINDIQFYLDNI